tara:strand:+ start:544 stop:984 length:441 start_codon:yes stop_codon:yes gene_type:complete
MAKIKYKPYQKLLILFFNNKDEKGRAKVTVDEIVATMADQIHMYRLSTYIWHIKTNVNGVVRSIRGDTPETKRKVVAYELCNVNEVADRLKVMGIMDASQTFIDIPVKTLKKFRPKKVKKLTDLNAQLSDALKDVETTEKAEERVI